MSMTMEDEKSKLEKLLVTLEEPELKLSKRCSDIIKKFHEMFDNELEEEEQSMVKIEEIYENPYKADKQALEENERKLQKLLAETKRIKKEMIKSAAPNNNSDTKRPWRINTGKEKLLRIDNELKSHHEKGFQPITPLPERDMEALITQCVEENKHSKPISGDRLRESVEAAKKGLPNFQYKKIENSTATALLFEAHIDASNQTN